MSEVTVMLKTIVPFNNRCFSVASSVFWSLYTVSVAHVLLQCGFLGILFLQIYGTFCFLWIDALRVIQVRDHLRYEEAWHTTRFKYGESVAIHFLITLFKIHFMFYEKTWVELIFKSSPWMNLFRQFSESFIRALKLFKGFLIGSNFRRSQYMIWNLGNKAAILHTVGVNNDSEGSIQLKLRGNESVFIQIVLVLAQ